MPLVKDDQVDKLAVGFKVMMNAQIFGRKGKNYKYLLRPK